MDTQYQSEIRESTIRELIEKVRKQSYNTYLKSMRLERIRQFSGATINFDFPVTALIGPNGSGKSTVLNASTLPFDSSQPQIIFRKSIFGDKSMKDWQIEYETIDKNINPTGTIRSIVTYDNDGWRRDTLFNRNIKIYSINRTVPASENPLFLHRKQMTSDGIRRLATVDSEEVDEIDLVKAECEKVLGRSLSDFKIVNATFRRTKTRNNRKWEFHNKTIDADGIETLIRKLNVAESKPITKEVIQTASIYIVDAPNQQYSEFQFGSGEASVIRTISDIESQPNGSLLLIEEIENGLHPLAVRRMVEYLIGVAKRKNFQVIFTTHSDYAIAPLPSEAIWAAIDGKLQQGKLSIEVLRAVSGRIDKKMAIFVEDEFTKFWAEAIIRERFGDRLDEIGVYPLAGDGNAVNAHKGHCINPAVGCHSLCLIDGDSRQSTDEKNRVYRFPGQLPESEVFNSVLSNIDSNIVQLTLACQRPIDKQDEVARFVKDVSRTNRDGHLLFGQVGLKLGLIPEATVRGAFLTLWIQENPDKVNAIAKAIQKTLDLPAK